MHTKNRINMNTVKILLVIFFIIFTGCTVESEVSESSLNKHCICKDFRDGEVFEFNTNDIRNVRVGIGTTTGFDVKDSNGKERFLSSDMDEYIKCKCNVK